MRDTRDDKLDDRLWYTQEDLKALGIRYSYGHLHRMIREGKFPAPVSPPGSKLMWDAPDIHRWIDERRQASRARPRLRLVPKASPPPEPKKKKIMNVWPDLGEVIVDTRAEWAILLGALAHEVAHR